MVKVGIGFDLHRLVENRKLFLGGVEIPYIKGLLGHSDGDVLLHALADAILGGIGEEDLGEHFPDSDLSYENVSSSFFIEKILDLAHKRGYRILNVDTIIVAEEPKLTPFKKKIKENLARMLKIDVANIAMKAKTNEGVGELGRREAIASYVVILLEKE